MRLSLGSGVLVAISLVTAVGCAPMDELEEQGHLDSDLMGTDDGDDDADEDTSGVALVAGKSNGAACPTDGRVTQGFSKKHDGLDLANARGTHIFAIAAGTVTASGPASGYGQWIRITHDDGSMSEYGHMFQRDVKVGQRVRAGQRIALMGSEGRSSGPHLHLRVYKSAKRTGSGNGTSPVEYLRARGISVPCKPGVVETSTPAAQSAGTVTLWKAAEVRSEERLDADVVAQASAGVAYDAACWKTGDDVSDSGYSGDRWVKVTVDGVTGWVSGVFLKGDATGGVSVACP